MIDHLELIGAVATAHRGGVLAREQALYLIDLVTTDARPVDVVDVPPAIAVPASTPAPRPPRVAKPVTPAAAASIGCPSCERTFATAHALAIHRSRIHPAGTPAAPPAAAVATVAQFPDLGPIASSVDTESARARAAAAL